MLMLASTSNPDHAGNRRLVERDGDGPQNCSPSIFRSRSPTLTSHMQGPKRLASTLSGNFVTSHGYPPVLRSRPDRMDPQRRQPPVAARPDLAALSGAFRVPIPIGTRQRSDLLRMTAITAVVISDIRGGVLA